MTFPRDDKTFLTQNIQSLGYVGRSLSERNSSVLGQPVRQLLVGSLAVAMMPKPKRGRIQTMNLIRDRINEEPDGTGAVKEKVCACDPRDHAISFSSWDQHDSAR
jgi:hypothetical protein